MRLLESLRPRDKRIATAAAVVVCCILVWAGSALWQASRAIDEATEERRQASTFAFEARPLERQASPVEFIASPAGWRDAIVFQDRLYICGSTGLFVYDSEGRLVERFRAGEQLPPAPLIALATGVIAGATGPELWIATAGEGLVSYNGRAFRHIRPREPHHRKLTSLVALSSGRLLLGTEKAGVLVFDGSTLSSFHDSLRDFHVTALAAGESGVWAGTIDRGLLHWQGGRVNKFETPDPRVLSIALRDDVTYAGTAVGALAIRGDRVDRTIGDGLFVQAVQAHATRVLLGTHEDGLYEFPTAGSRRRASRSTDTQAAIHRILELRGATYALTADGLYDVRTWERVAAPEPSQLTDGNIAALAAEPNGRVWVGYFDRGLDVMEAGRVQHREDEHLFCVNRIVHVPDENGWAVATANGLVMMDEHAAKRRVIGREQGLIANHVTDVAVFGDSMVAATPAGVTFVSKDGPRSLYAFHGLVNNHVYALGVVDGRLLAGTLGGLSILESDFVKANYTTANSPLGHNWVSAVTAFGHDWMVGTYGSGVYRLEPNGTWHTFSDMPSGIEVNPNALLSTQDRVYAGTLGRGLLIYNAAQNRWRTFTNGLPSSNVTALSAQGGYLYVGTDNGLVRVKESEL